MTTTKFLTAAAIMCAGMGAFAQQTATQVCTATVNVITPISITATNSVLDFGTIAVDPSAGGSVILSYAGGRSTTGKVTAVDNATNAGKALNLTVAGEGSYLYNITLPASIVVTNGTPAQDMTVNAWTCSSAATKTAGTFGGALSSGSQQIQLGATLTVAPAQPKAVYTNAGFNVTVQYQ
jgi:hypothetical protein